MNPGREQALGEGLLVGRSLVDLRSSLLPVRVMNLSNKPRKLPKGTYIGLCEPVISVSEVEETPYCGTGKHEECHSDGRLPDHLQELYNRSKDNLTDMELGQVRELLGQVFSKSSMDLGRTSLVKHSIDVEGAMPIRQPPQKIPLAKRDEAEEAVQEMQRQGVIEPSRSPWSSPVVLVRKKDGTNRFCVDYRKLNALTKKDSYPLPRIDSILDALEGSTWFSTLDLKSGYWQVEEIRRKRHSQPDKVYGSSRFSLLDCATRQQPLRG